MSIISHLISRYPFSFETTLRLICNIIFYGIMIIDLALCAKKIKRFSSEITNDTFQRYSTARLKLIYWTSLLIIINAALTVPRNLGTVIGFIPPAPLPLYIIGIAAIFVVSIGMRCIGLFCSSILTSLIVPATLFQFAISSDARQALSGIGMGYFGLMFFSFLTLPADVLGLKFFRKGLLDDIVESLEVPNPAPLSPTPTDHIQPSPTPAIRRK